MPDARHDAREERLPPSMRPVALAADSFGAGPRVQAGDPARGPCLPERQGDHEWIYLADPG